MNCIGQYDLQRHHYKKVLFNIQIVQCSYSSPVKSLPDQINLALSRAPSNLEI